MLFSRLLRIPRRLLPAAAVLIACAAAQAQPTEEVPFITSPDHVTLEMLGMAGVQRGDHVIDLGSGDGRIVILAARRFEATGLGVEIDPDLVQRSIANAREAGVADRVQFREQDLFKTDLSAATVVTMYLLQEVNLALRPSLLALQPGTRVVSHDWDMGDWQPDRTSVVAVPDKKVGLEKSSKVHLWVVPARIDGLWCGNGLLRGGSFRLKQSYQAFEGTLSWRNRERPVSGRIAGSQVKIATGRYGDLVLQVTGDQMRLVSAEGDLALARGVTFNRMAAGSCA